MQLPCTSRSDNQMQSGMAELHAERSTLQASVMMAVTARAHTHRPGMPPHLAVLLLYLLAAGQHTLS